MCLIVDANQASLVFGLAKSPGLLALRNAIFSDRGKIKVVCGGALIDEYRLAGVLRVIRALDQAGRVRIVPSKDVDSETDRLRHAGVCRSNDQHIIALARVSGVRVLCTRDAELHADFKNPKLISKPRGQIYQTERHQRLLAKHCR
jgi:hypothetical protein